MRIISPGWVNCSLNSRNQSSTCRGSFSSRRGIFLSHYYSLNRPLGARRFPTMEIPYLTHLTFLTYLTHLFLTGINPKCSTSQTGTAKSASAISRSHVQGNVNGGLCA